MSAITATMTGGEVAPSASRAVGALARREAYRIGTHPVGLVLLLYYLVLGGAQATSDGLAARDAVHHVLLIVGLLWFGPATFFVTNLVASSARRSNAESQLAAALKSELSGIVVMSLIFGLAHAPGFIFRHAGELEGLGPHPSALDAVAYSIVVLAVSGIAFGVIWARTKNLFALMIVHAAGDLLPNFSSFVRTWF